MSSYRDEILKDPEAFARGYEKPVLRMPYGKLFKPPSQLNLLTHSHVYDFCKNRFYKCKISFEHKYGAPIREVECFTKKGRSIVTAEEMLEAMKDTFAENAWECMIESDTYIAAYFPPTICLDDSLLVLVNLLRVLSLGQYSLLGSDEIAEIVYPSEFSRNLHWIWFKHSPFPKASHAGIRSWMELNPELSFHVWTDCPISEAEEYFGEFVKDARVTLHSVSEIVELGLPSKIAEDAHRSAVLLKTDLARIYILQKYGGWYVDINDTMCLVPLKYLVHDADTEILRFGSDYTTYGVNNYCLYWHSEHPLIWKCLHEHILPHVEFLYSLIYENSTSTVGYQILQECMEILHATRQDYILEAIGGQFPRWLSMINEALAAWGSPYFERLKMDVGMLISFLAAMWKVVDPDSPSLQQWWVELKALRQWNARTLQPVWKTIAPHRIPFRIADIKNVLDTMGKCNWSEAYPKMHMKLQLNQLIQYCNIGLAIQNMKLDSLIAYPYSAFPEGISFVTPLVHFGDGTTLRN